MDLAFLNSLKVSVVGLLVVFLGLVLLIGCITLMRNLVSRLQKNDKEAAAPVQSAAQPAAPAVPVTREYTPGPELKLPDPALYAVITAAVAAELEQEGVNPQGGFAIRSVKPL